MAKLAIVEKGDPILETPATEVALKDISSAKVKTLIKDMKETLHAISDGVGLAAPQVGSPLRIFIVSKRVFEKDKKKKGVVAEPTAPLQDLVCINPKIVKASKTKKWLAGEGCLSVRWFYGKVLRSTHVSLEYYDEEGKKQTRGAGGILSHIFQHECDHLEGHLFIDKAIDVEWLEPEESKK
ncbi:MAG: peptide deformylase [Patescibacteria group bacterium]